MKRIIVSIVSEQTVPNYLFIKELFQIGDELLFVSSSKYADRIDWILQTLNYKNCRDERIVFPERGEPAESLPGTERYSGSGGDLFPVQQSGDQSLYLQQGGRSFESREDTSYSHGTDHGMRRRQ